MSIIMPVRRLWRAGLLPLVLFLLPQSAAAQLLTEWHFDANLNAIAGTGTIAYFNTATQTGTAFGTTASFGIPAVGGRVDNVMRFPAMTAPAMGYRVDHKAPANGGGQYVNQYTMVWDLFLPSTTNPWFSFYNTNETNANDGEFFFQRIDANGGNIGISGQYDGRVNFGAWHRIALVYDATAPADKMVKYVDGTRVAAQNVGALDDRWTLYTASDATPYFVLFGDEDGESMTGYLANYLFVDRAYTTAQITALGGPNALGITVIPEPSSMLLAGLGLAAAAAWRRRRGRSRSES
jgi:hypothetical protein